MNTTFIQPDVECPCGHVFDVRRRYTSAGYVTGTHCPKCAKQFDVWVPNEVPPEVKGRKMRESDIEDRLVRRVRDLGGEVRKVEWIGRKGAPDRLVMLSARTIWVELKAPGKAALFPRNAHERGQHREHERMRRMGQVVHVIDSYEDIERILA